MSNSLFPTIHGLGWGGVKIPLTETIVQRAASGREVRAQLYRYPLYEWKLPFNYLWDGRYSQQDFKSLLGFILQRAGAYDSFLYDDPTDDAVTTQLIAVGDGVTVTFSAVRTIGGFTEPVDWLQTLTNVTVGGSPTSAFTVNQSAATVTFTSPPGAGQNIVGDLTYYFRVRFNSDQTELRAMFYQIWEAQEIDLIRVKS